MNRAPKYSHTGLDLFFMATIVALLILLRYFLRNPRALHRILPARTSNSNLLELDEIFTERAPSSASITATSIENDQTSTTDEMAFDSGNESAPNIVNIVSEPTIDEAAVPTEAAVSDPEVDSEVQDDLAEREAKQLQELEELIERTEAYCVKCREKRDMQNARRIVTKNGRNAMEGTCPVCGTRLFRFIAR